MIRPVLALVALLFLTAALGAVTIRLKPAVRVEAAEVFLGDIADVMAADGRPLAGRAGWPGIPVFLFSGETLTATLTYADVGEAIIRATGRPFVLVGSTVRLSRAARVIGHAEILDFVRTRVRDLFPGRHLELGAVPAEIVVPGSEVGLRLDVAPEQPAAGAFAASLVVVRGTNELARHVLNGRLLTPGRIAVLVRPLARGQIPAGDDIRYEAVPDLADLDRPVTDLAAVKGRRVLADMSQGERLFAAHFEKPLNVRRGQEVTVSWRRAGVVIEAVAIALEDGREGDFIRLRNPYTSREFNAQVGASGGKVQFDG